VGAYVDIMEVGCCDGERVESCLCAEKGDHVKKIYKKIWRVS
jgi:hypothetical protein